MKLKWENNCALLKLSNKIRDFEICVNVNTKQYV